jgi:hypothetical protein
MRYPVNIYVQEGQVSSTFGFHGELNGFMDAVEVM